MAPGGQPDRYQPPVSLPVHHLDMLLAVATLYVDTFSYGDYMTLAERMALRDVEAILELYGRRSYGPPQAGTGAQGQLHRPEAEPGLDPRTHGPRQ